MRTIAGLAMTLCVGLSAAAPGSPGPMEYDIDGGRLGPVAVYAPEGVPGSVVLFIAGDDGRDSRVVGMANQLRSWGALVAVIDPGRSLQGSNPAVEFEQLGHVLEKRAGLRNYRAPLLVGYSSGGRLAHTVAMEDPHGTFGGVITLGACVNPAAVPPAQLQPRATTPGPPWLALHGALDRVCSAEAVRAVVALDPAAKFVLLPKVGHAFTVEADWLPQFQDAYAKMVTATTERSPVVSPAAGPVTGPVASPVADLPLAEVMARPVAAGPLADTFVVLLTGDGGWAGLDQEVAAALAQRGIPVVALSTLRYFWRERTPGEAALDLNRIIQHYVIAWRRHQVLLVGYSFGANVLPFLVGQLPRTSRHAIRGISLLAPATHTGFEVHVADWIPGSVPEGRPVRPALEALAGMPILCLTGVGEGDNLCAALPKGLARTVELPGGHHFDGDSATLATEILSFTGL